jgi:hypothetical protein
MKSISTTQQYADGEPPSRGDGEAFGTPSREPHDASGGAHTGAHTGLAPLGMPIVNGVTVDIPNVPSTTAAARTPWNSIATGDLGADGGTIHVWLTSLDARAQLPLGPADGLGSKEVAHAMYLLPARSSDPAADEKRLRAQRALTARRWLHAVLGELLRMPAADVPVTVDQFGRPCWVSRAGTGSPPPAWSFSLAQAGPWALCAVSSDWRSASTWRRDGPSSGG